MSRNWNSWADEEEIDTFEEFVEEFLAGRLRPEDFRRFRVHQGVYGQRQPDVQMLRVRVPWGGLTTAQLECLADIAQQTPRSAGHVTTRQNIQFHSVKLRGVPELMRSLAEVGLTSRESGGNAVRNVTLGHCAGICSKEPFDPTPYADLVARFFLRNPMNQNLPRKLKIAFSGCSDDTGLTAIHDIGARAAVREEDGRILRGFEIVFAGGLGPVPRVAQPLEPFTLAEDLVPTVAAIVRIFDRLGNRDNRNLARLKFVVQSLGTDSLRTLILREREALQLTMAGRFPEPLVWEERPPARGFRRGIDAAVPSDDPVYQRWVGTNVLPQRQAGYAAVQVRLPLGDVTSDQLRVLARAAREVADGAVQTTNQQNMLFRWVPEQSLPALYAMLAGAQLALPGSERAIDITSCPGADTCQLGITASRGLAQAIGDVLGRDVRDLAEQMSLRIKISGCPNSCSQHHIADIGLFGGAKKFHGEQVPTYQLLVGGTADPASPRFGKPLARIPAKLAPAAVRELLLVYGHERISGETFGAFVDRVGVNRLKELLARWTELPPPTLANGDYLDWGAAERFTIETGSGDCAA